MLHFGYPIWHFQEARSYASSGPVADDPISSPTWTLFNNDASETGNGIERNARGNEPGQTDRKGVERACA